MYVMLIVTQRAHCQGVTSVYSFHMYVLFLQAQGTVINNWGGRVEHLDKPKEMCYFQFG